MELLQDNLVVLLQGSLSDLKAARSNLERGGIPAEIVQPPGCSPNS